MAIPNLYEEYEEPSSKEMFIPTPPRRFLTPNAGDLVRESSQNALQGYEFIKTQFSQNLC